MDDPTKVSAQPVPTLISPGKDLGFVPTASTPSTAPVKSATEDSIEKILDELEQEYKKKPVIAEAVKPAVPMNVSATPSTSVIPPKMTTGATIPDTTTPVPKKFILPPVQNAPQNNSSGGGLLKKLGGTKFVVGAIGLFLAIGGLTSVIMLSQQSQDVRQRAANDCSSNCQANSFCYNECIGSGQARSVSCGNGTWEVGNPFNDSACPGGGNGNGGSNADDGSGTGDTSNPPGDDGNNTGRTCPADCGNQNQGACPANCVGANSQGCRGDLGFCGGGCYPSGWRECPGQAGCRDPQYACAGADQCAGITCQEGFHCNGGACISNETGGGGEICSDDRPQLKYVKYVCPQGCGSDGQCEGDDSGAVSSDVTSSTTLGTNDCGQIDVYSWQGACDGGSYVYSQVKQNTCGSSSCGTSTPPPSNPPSSPNPTPSPGSPVCIGLTSSIAIPTLGSAPVFTCAVAQTVTRYEFRWNRGGGVFAALDPNSATSNVSEPLDVNASGLYTVQCRPCNGSACSNWESL